MFSNPILRKIRDVHSQISWRSEWSLITKSTSPSCSLVWLLLSAFNVSIPCGWGFEGINIHACKCMLVLGGRPSSYTAQVKTAPSCDLSRLSWLCMKDICARREVCMEMLWDECHTPHQEIVSSMEQKVWRAEKECSWEKGEICSSEKLQSYNTNRIKCFFIYWTEIRWARIY